ncbi:MAG: GDYXXLXY domain-containing protein [Synergistaceae bacterium]|jgi:uncharacterized membrane-anchored protein|nr:GDYXXLXY domain-containing protein [Synergistaceae bacterium]
MKKVSELFKNMGVKYTAIAVLPILTLLWIPMTNFVTLFAGESVLLEVIPVDPRDFLRGDYVILGYKISDIPGDLVPPDIADGSYGYRKTRDVCVALEKDSDGIGRVKGVSAESPGGLYLKGSINRDSTVQYEKINAYYVPEGTGREIENKIRESNVLADLRVLRGNAVIKGLVFAEDGGGKTRE